MNNLSDAVWPTPDELMKKTSEGLRLMRDIQLIQEWDEEDIEKFAMLSLQCYLKTNALTLFVCDELPNSEEAFTLLATSQDNYDIRGWHIYGDPCPITFIDILLKD